MSSPIPFHTLPLKQVVSLAINGMWYDITGDTFFEKGVTIERGSGPDTPEIEAAHATLVLNNSTGKYTRRNPEGSLYGWIVFNQPARIDRQVITSEFGSPVSNGLPPTNENWLWTLYGEGGTVQNSDWSSSSGMARLSIPVANAKRLNYINDSAARWRNAETLVTFQMPTADITGGAVTAGLVFRGQSAAGGSYQRIYAKVNTDETISLELGFGDGTVLNSVATGIVHTGQKLRLCAGFDGHTLYGKIWDDTAQEPIDWLIEHHDGTWGVGFLGFEATRFTGNSNTSPFSVAFDNFVVRSPRLVGTIADWPPRWDSSGNFRFAPINISGITRRLDNNKAPIQSCLRYELPRLSGLVQYWPCEEESGATELASAIPGAPPIAFEGNTDPVRTAAYNDFVASKPVPLASKARWRGNVPEYTGTGVVQVRWIMHLPATGIDDQAILFQIFTTGTASCWELIYNTGGNVQVRAFDPQGNVLTTSSSINLGLNDTRVRFSYTLVDEGSDVRWKITAPDEEGNPATEVNALLTGRSCGAVWDVRYAVGNPTVNVSDMAIGHVTVQNVETAVFDMYQQFSAFNGETTGFRFVRLCEQEGINGRYIGDILTSTQMGPQRVAVVKDLFNDIAKAEQGAIYETKTRHDSYTLRLMPTLQNQDRQLQLSLSNKELADDFEPDDDLDRRYNDFTLDRERGGTSHTTQATGPFSADQIGIRPFKDTVNIYIQGQLGDINEWIKYANTFDEFRFSSLSVNMGSTALSASHSQSRFILDLELYDRMVLANASNRKLFTEIEQLPRGYKEEIDQLTHKIQWNTFPGGPYLTISADDSTYGVLDTDGTTLKNNINTSATALELELAYGEPLWDTANPPATIIVGGEIMTVNSIVSTVPQFIAVGTAGVADNANVGSGQGLGLPAGGTTTGDTLICFAAVRNFSATLTMNNGYNPIIQLADIVIFAKTHSGSETVPTVTVSGASAGSTVQAVIFSVRNIPADESYLSQQFNGSQQNIPFPEMQGTLADWIAIYFGRKDDDWTGVDPIYNATEIADLPTTVGNDQGISVQYGIGKQQAAIAAGQFTVTGGVSGSSRGVIAVFGTRQVINVTRSTNNVVKEHLAGTPVHTWPPLAAGLGHV